MPRITFIAHTGERYCIDADCGQSLMQAAINHQVPGVIGDCGGNCACATCHGYIQGPLATELSAVKPLERDMLYCALEVNEHSRLLCQIIVNQDLEGLEVTLPSAQN